MSFAVGKYSQAICDRCGFQVPYLELSKEWLFSLSRVL
jgi:hypothetical protein